MRLPLIIASCLVAAALPAAEETLPPQDRAAALRELDRDRDGDRKLSLAEFETIPLNRSDQPGKFRNPDRG